MRLLCGAEMTPPALADVIAALEAATVGSRELNHMVAHVTGWITNNRLDQAPWEYLGWCWNDASEPRGENKVHTPRWTTSVDAALTLAEHPNHGVRLSIWCDCAKAEIRRGDGFTEGNASTASLALCIAALRARAAQEADHG